MTKENTLFPIYADIDPGYKKKLYAIILKAEKNFSTYSHHFKEFIITQLKDKGMTVLPELSKKKFFNDPYLVDGII